MTAKQVQVRRDTATNLNTSTPAEGEVGYDTTNKRLVAGDGVTPGGILHANAIDIQNNRFTYAAVSGTANAIVLTGSPQYTSLVTGQEWVFKATGSSNGAVTINPDGLGATAARLMYNGVLTALGSKLRIVAGGIYRAYYDGTYIQVHGIDIPPPPGGLVYLGEFTASNSPSLNITSLISSDYDDYVVALSNIAPATNAVDLILRTSTNNGSSFDSGATDYHRVRSTSTGTTTTVTGGSSDSLSLIASLPDGAALGASGEIRLYNLNSTSVRKMIRSELVFYTGSAAAIVTCGGFRNSNADIDAIQLRMSSGNIASGTVRVYGISKL